MKSSTNKKKEYHIITPFKKETTRSDIKMFNSFYKSSNDKLFKDSSSLNPPFEKLIPDQNFTKKENLLTFFDKTDLLKTTDTKKLDFSSKKLKEEIKLKKRDFEENFLSGIQILKKSKK